MQAVSTYEDFHASHNHMPGSDRAMGVTGTVVFRTGGWSCRLEAVEGNTGINPEMLRLNLILDGPSGSAGETDVLTPCPVEWSVPDPAIEYQHVEFRVIGTDDAPPETIPVDHPQ
jgi:hypothetical protein